MIHIQSMITIIENSVKTPKRRIACVLITEYLGSVWSIRNSNTRSNTNCKFKQKANLSLDWHIQLATSTWTTELSVIGKSTGNLEKLWIQFVLITMIRLGFYPQTHQVINDLAALVIQTMILTFLPNSKVI